MSAELKDYIEYINQELQETSSQLSSSDNESARDRSCRVGSAALEACLDQHHVVTAFVRNPAKLPLELRTHPRLRIIKGDATNHTALIEAIHDQDAVIQAAVHDSYSPYAKGDGERVIRCIIRAIKEVQAMRRYSSPPIRLWVLSGQVMLDIPSGNGRIEGDIIPIHPQHYHNYAFLQQDARDVDWSLVHPGKFDRGDVRVLLYMCR